MVVGLVAHVGVTSRGSRRRPIHMLCHKGYSFKASLVQGILSFLSTWVHLLFHTGSCCSFISILFAHIMHLHEEVLSEPIYVDTVGEHLFRIGSVCCRCKITICDHVFVFNFVVFKMLGFDIVIVSDWLAHFHDVINCEKSRVSMVTVDGINEYYQVEVRFSLRFL